MASFNNPVDVRLWGDEKFRALSKAQPNAQTLWLYLLTGPHNRGLPGLYNTGAGDMGEILGWQPGDICAMAHELAVGDKPMLVADWPARVLLLPQVFYYRPPGSPSNLSAWVKPFDAIPESRLKGRWLVCLAEHCTTRGPEFFNAFRRIFAQQLMACSGQGLLFDGLPMADGLLGNTPSAGGGVTPGAGGGADADNPNPNPNPSPRPKPPAAMPAEAMQAVDLLVMLMVENDTRAKVPDAGSPRYATWVSDVERLHRIDGRPWEEIEAVIRWSQRDGFWKSNILSAGKLREQFPKLRGQMSRKAGVAGRNADEFQRAIRRSRREP